MNAEFLGMIRIPTWESIMIRTLLAITGLTLLWVLSGATSAQPKEPTLPDGGWPKQVTGRGETEESARAVALKEAVREVIALMKQQNPPLTAFVPNEAYVSTHVLKGTGRPGKEIEIDVVEKGQKIIFKEWVLVFRADDWWKDIVLRDREADRQNRAALRELRAIDRQAFLARLLFGIGVVLVSGFGYVQLDRYTHHRHTTWLRVASVGLVSLVLAVYWLVFQVPH